MDVLLVALPYDKLMELGYPAIEHGGIGSLAAFLRRYGLETGILDANLNELDQAEIITRIIRAEARVIGFSLLLAEAPLAITIIEKLRIMGLHSHITIGGYLPTFACEALFKQCADIDSIIRGEGEYTLLELTQRIKKKEVWRDIKGISYVEGGTIIHNPPRPLIEDLDTLPFFVRDMLPKVLKKKGVPTVFSSRGCYRNCAFCSVNAFYKSSPGANWRARSAENVVDELEIVGRVWGQRQFSFHDDNFIGPGEKGIKRAYEIGRQILRRGLDIEFNFSLGVKDVQKDLLLFLKEVGLRSVFLGVESMVERTLELFNKQVSPNENEMAIQVLEELGIFYHVGFIMYDPFTTLDEVEKNVEFLDRLKDKKFCRTFYFDKRLKLFRGTLLERYLKEKGLSIATGFHYTYKMQDDRVELLHRLVSRLLTQRCFQVVRDMEERLEEPADKKEIEGRISALYVEVFRYLIDWLRNKEDISKQSLFLLREINNALKLIETRITELTTKAKLVLAAGK